MDIEIEILLRLVLASVLGAGIGYQRERAHKPAGRRTHALIGVGAALFTAASIFGFGSGVDVSRVAAGVVAGVGFIGGGVIFRGGDHVEGLTTAASIWVTAAVGLAAGAGMYLIATGCALIAAIVLAVPKKKA